MNKKICIISMLSCLSLLGFASTNKVSVINKKTECKQQQLKVKSLTKEELAKLDKGIKNILFSMMLHSAKPIFREDYEAGLKLIKKYGKTALIKNIENKILSLESEKQRPPIFLSSLLFIYMEYVTQEEYYTFYKCTKNKMPPELRWYTYEPQFSPNKKSGSKRQPHYIIDEKK